VTGTVPMQTLHLVDASMYVFRAWHSMPDEFHDADGWPTNAVHGFARFLLELLERERPRHIAVAFDEALDSCFRNGLYPAYKANRDPAPPELRRQFVWCKALCQALGLVTLAHGDFEADDLIGSAAHRARGNGFRSIIVSADKDLSQLLCVHDEQYDFAKGQRWGEDGVKARHGVHAHREHALLWRQLTTIPLDVPLPDGDFARGSGDAVELQSLADWIGFGPLTRKRLSEAAGLPG